MWCWCCCCSCMFIPASLTLIRSDIEKPLRLFFLFFWQRFSVRLSHCSQSPGRLKLNTFIMFCLYGSRLDTIRWNFNKVWGRKHEVITNTKAGKTGEYESTHRSNKTTQIYTFSNENDCTASRGDRENKGLSSEAQINRALEPPTTHVMANCRFLIWNKVFYISHWGPRT